jgi:hypothetical protein
MASDTRVVRVPINIEGEVARLLPILRQETRKLGPAITDADIEFEWPMRKDMLGGFVGEAFLFLSGAVASAITKKWVEEVLWPRIKPHARQYTDDILALLLELVEDESRGTPR